MTLFGTTKNSSYSKNTDSFVIIHSAKSRSTHTDAPWIKLTKRIFSGHDPKKEILITSIGMLHYDIVLREWMRRGGFSRVILYRSVDDWPDKMKELYGWVINKSKIKLIQPPPSNRSTDSGNKDKQELYLARDRYVIDSAAIVEVGCVRHKGRMSALLKNINPQFQLVRNWSLTKAEKMETELHVIPRFKLPENINSFDNYVWHFTRTRFAPWPDKTMADYLDDLLGHGQKAPYSAETVLKQIIKERRIRSSSYLVKGNQPVVCFSSATWETVKTLFTWQNHLRRFRFEPFGVGVTKSELKKLGIYPVIYASENDYKKLDQDERWRYQKHDQYATKWIDEAEWRCKNDLNLSSIKACNIAILTPNGIYKMESWQ